MADASLVHFAGGQGGRLLSTGLFSAAQVLVCLEECGGGGSDFMVRGREEDLILSYKYSWKYRPMPISQTEEV